MAVSVLWQAGWNETGGYLVGSPTTWASGSYIGFYGPTFNTAIPINGYNSVTAITDKTGTVNNGTLPNIKYLTNSTGTWTNDLKGSVTGDIADASFGDMTLHIQIVSGSAIRLSSVNLIAYEGADISNAPTDATILGFEQGSATWTTMAGSAAPLALTPHTASGSLTHDYYVGLSCQPQTTLGSSSLSATAISFAITATWY